MKIKVGHEWFEADIGQPIMVVLEDQDKSNISNMHPDATKYAIFADCDLEFTTEDQKRAWMRR